MGDGMVGQRSILNRTEDCWIRALPFSVSTTTPGPRNHGTASAKMGERKVLNKYYPPDFDPREVPKKLTPRHFKQITIRTMLPMSIRCSTCGEFVYMGRKFNARQERAPEHDYLGIRVFRQYIRCPSCKCEIIFRTDPKNSDYVLEAGATRNFEPWKQKAAVEAIVQEERDREDREDSMKALENRTLESKREMDQLGRSSLLPLFVSLSLCVGAFICESLSRPPHYFSSSWNSLYDDRCIGGDP